MGRKTQRIFAAGRPQPITPRVFIRTSHCLATEDQLARVIYIYTSVIQQYNMSADTDAEMRQLNTRIPKVLDEEIDNTWKARGFASKSEFVRHALRVAIGPVELSEETRAILKETESELERGETVSHEDLKRELDLE